MTNECTVVVVVVDADDDVMTCAFRCALMATTAVPLKHVQCCATLDMSVNALFHWFRCDFDSTAPTRHGHLLRFEVDSHPKGFPRTEVERLVRDISLLVTEDVGRAAGCATDKTDWLTGHWQHRYRRTPD